MRIIGDIPHPDCKITIYAWNTKYLIKIEKNNIEQTFKIPEVELSSEAELYEIVKGEFLEDALARFKGMQESLKTALNRLD